MSKSEKGALTILPVLPYMRIEQAKYTTETLKYDGIHIVLCVSGCITVKTDRKSYTLTEGSYLIVRRLESHSVMSDLASGLRVLIDSARFEKEIGGIWDIPICCDSDIVKLAGEESGSRISYILTELYNCAGDSNVFVESYNIGLIHSLISLLSAFVHIQRASMGESVISDMDDRLRRLFDYTKLHSCENISVEKAAEITGHNKASFCRYFKKVTGITFHTYMTRLRVIKATEMMRGGYTIEDIIDLLGVADYKSLTVMFQRVLDMTPTRYFTLYAGRDAHSLADKSNTERSSDEPSSFMYNPTRTRMETGFTTLRKDGAISLKVPSYGTIMSGRTIYFALSDHRHHDQAHTDVIDADTGQSLSEIGEDCFYLYPYSENGVCYATGVQTKDSMAYGGRVVLYRTEDFTNWSRSVILNIPHWHIFTAALAKHGTEYILSMQVAYAGSFHIHFAHSSDLASWTLFPNKQSFPSERYCGFPIIYGSGDYIYLIFSEALPMSHYLPYIYRTSDFVTWETGLYNPLITLCEADRDIAESTFPFTLTEAERVKIRKSYVASIFNVSCYEKGGKTIIMYTVSDQSGYCHICRAVYDGGLNEFLSRQFK